MKLKNIIVGLFLLSTTVFCEELTYIGRLIGFSADKGIVKMIIVNENHVISERNVAHDIFHFETFDYQGAYVYMKSAGLLTNEYYIKKGD